MKCKKAIVALMTLAFGIGVHAAAQADTKSSENFDSATAEEKLDTTSTSCNKNWIPWTTSESEDDALTIKAWGDATQPNTRPDWTSADTQANYLSVETSFTNAVCFSVSGPQSDNKTPTPFFLEDNQDQIYFDSLVNLTAGDADTLAAVGMPDNARLALWLQEKEDDEGNTSNLLCIRAGKMTEGGTDVSANVYTSATEVATGWHRLTVRLFKNSMRTGEAFPALAVYIDQSPVAVNAEDAPFLSGKIADMVPKCALLANTNALFPSMKKNVDIVSGDIAGVSFAGNGAIDDIAFTTARPSFIGASADVNYFHLAWDENVTGVSYTIDSDSAVTVSTDELDAGSVDIALTDGQETAIAVTATYEEGFGAGDWEMDNATFANGTYTVSAGTITASGKIVSASTVATASAKITIGEITTEMTGTTLLNLISAIGDMDISDGTNSIDIAITLLDDQVVTLTLDEENSVEGYVTFDVLGNVSVNWTLDLNGHSITGAGSGGGGVGESVLIYNYATLVIEDNSTDKTGKIVHGTNNDPYGHAMIENGGTLTVKGGTFDGRVYFFEGDNDYPAGTGSFEGGTFKISYYGGEREVGDSNNTYLKFLNENAAEGLTFNADENNAYYVASSDDTPTAEVVAKIGDTGYDTIQKAIDAAIASQTTTDSAPVTVSIVKSVDIDGNMTLCGKGRDVTDITLSVEEGVTVNVTNREHAIISLDNATVTFSGSGTWSKPNPDENYKTKTAFPVGENAVDGALAPADVIIEGGNFVIGNSHVFSIQNGTIVVNGGSLSITCGSSAYCIRAEESEVKDSDGTTLTCGEAAVIVKGGTFSSTSTTVPLVGAKAKSDSVTVAIDVDVDGTAKFSGDETQICDVMDEYLATVVENFETSAGEWDITDVTEDYKFKKGSDNYYAASKIQWAAVQVTWDSNVASWAAKDGDDAEDAIVYPSDEITQEVSSYTADYDIDEQVTFTVTNYTFATGYELDEANSVLESISPTTESVTNVIKILSKVTAPAYQPVDGGSETACDSYEAASAMAEAINDDKTLINVPSELTTDELKAAYRGLFKATAYTYTDGTAETTTYSVQVNLTDEAEASIQSQVDAEVKKVDVANLATAEQKQTLTTTPGIYYSVVAGPTLDGMKVRSCAIATDTTLEVTLPKYDGAGFYRIKATVKAETPVTE